MRYGVALDKGVHFWYNELRVMEHPGTGDSPHSSPQGDLSGHFCPLAGSSGLLDSQKDVVTLKNVKRTRNVIENKGPAREKT